MIHNLAKIFVVTVLLLISVVVTIIHVFNGDVGGCVSGGVAIVGFGGNLATRLVRIYPRLREVEGK